MVFNLTGTFVGLVRPHYVDSLFFHLKSSETIEFTLTAAVARA